MKQILAQNGTQVCIETIRKYIIAQPWGKLRKQPRTFLLTQKNKVDRLLFAQRIHRLGFIDIENAEEFGKSILFTDEKYFYLTHKPNGQNHRYRGDISTIKDQKVPKFDNKVLVCAGFSYKGVTPIKFLTSTVNANNYVSDILPFYKRHFNRQSAGRGILQDAMFEAQGHFFLQDGATPHTANASIDYIQANFPDFFHDWPGNSPDLNHIENLWAIIQAKVDEYPFASNITELKKR